MKNTAPRNRTSAHKPMEKTRRTSHATGHRNRQETRKKILAAMGRVLARQGSEGLGINAIAREARVDKVLIYRYFGGFDELCRAFAVEGDTFPSLEEVAEGRLREFPSLQPSEVAKALLLGFIRAVRRRPVTKEIMRWELQTRNDLTDALAKERERRTQQWLALAPGAQSGDIAAVASIIAAGLVFLTLRAKTAVTYNGIDLHSESGWKRIEDAAALLCDLYFQKAAAAGQKISRDQSGSPQREVQP